MTFAPQTLRLSEQMRSDEEPPIPIPPGEEPPPPIKEPPDTPVVEPDGPVREPGPEEPRRLRYARFDLRALFRLLEAAMPKPE